MLSQFIKMFLKNESVCDVGAEFILQIVLMCKSKSKLDRTALKYLNIFTTLNVQNFAYNLTLGRLKAMLISCQLTSSSYLLYVLKNSFIQVSILLL